MGLLAKTTKSTNGTLKLKTELEEHLKEPTDIIPTAPPSIPPADLHTTPLLLDHTLAWHAVCPKRAAALDPAIPIPPCPKTVTLAAPLLATLLAPAELALTAS